MSAPKTVWLVSILCWMLASSQLLAQAPRDGERPGQGEKGGRPGERGAAMRGAVERTRNAGGALGAGQPGPGGGMGGPRMLMGRLPIVIALDADGNNEISASEIEGAVAALKKLDKNSDGKLTADELMPEGGMGLMAGPGLAGRPGPGGAVAALPSGEMLARMMESDKNKDSFVDKEEAPERMQAIFARIDSDSDGKLSKAELTIAATMLGGRRDGAGAAGPRGRNVSEDSPPPAEIPQRPTSE